MRSVTSSTLPHYNARPNASLPERVKNDNIGRSRITQSYHGYDGQLDTNIIDSKQIKYPKVRRLADEIAEHEIRRSTEKSALFIPKKYEHLYTYLDISNINGEYDQNSKSYNYNICDNKYYKNSFGRSGLENVYHISFGSMSIPNYYAILGYDMSKFFVSIGINEYTANVNFDYNIIYYPDNNASSTTRTVYRPSLKLFKLNGFSKLNELNLMLRDIASNIDIPTVTFDFELVTIGATTEFNLVNHQLTNGMHIFMSDKNKKKNIFPRLYPITIIDPNTISINVDTSGMTYLLGQMFEFFIDDYIFNLNIELVSIKEDRT